MCIKRVCIYIQCISEIDTYICMCVAVCCSAYLRERHTYVSISILEYTHSTAEYSTCVSTAECSTFKHRSSRNRILMRICKYIHISMCTYVYIYIYKYIMYICALTVCICIYKYIRICVCIYRVCIHTFEFTGVYA